MSSVVGPILQEAGIEYEVLITERQGHAHEIVQAELNVAKRYVSLFSFMYSIVDGIKFLRISIMNWLSTERSNCHFSCATFASKKLEEILR